jgi:predicted RNase H-like HicB family nuclease
MKYAAVIESAGSNYSAYVPDLPGCVATGDTLDEAASNIREAVQFHLDGLRADGLPIPAPVTRCEYIEPDPAS